MCLPAGFLAPSPGPQSVGLAAVGPQAPVQHLQHLHLKALCLQAGRRAAMKAGRGLGAELPCNQARLFPVRPRPAATLPPAACKWLPSVKPGRGQLAVRS